MIFSIRGKGGNTPFPSDTVPVTSMFLLGPAWVSSSAVIVTIPALVVSPAAIVSSRLSLKNETVPDVGDTSRQGRPRDGRKAGRRDLLGGRRQSETHRCHLDGFARRPGQRRPDLGVFPPFSSIGGRTQLENTLGVGSSSAIVSVAAAGSAAPPPVAAHVTSTVFSGASNSSRDTVTLSASLHGAVSIAVTVLWPPFSPADAGPSFVISRSAVRVRSPAPIKSTTYGDSESGQIKSRQHSVNTARLTGTGRLRGSEIPASTSSSVRLHEPQRAPRATPGPCPLDEPTGTPVRSPANSRSNDKRDLVVELRGRLALGHPRPKGSLAVDRDWTTERRPTPRSPCATRRCPAAEPSTPAASA